MDTLDIKIGRSEIRNKVIAQFFKEIRFTEEWGIGIRRIINACIDAGLEEPEFIETGMFFKVIIKKKSGDKTIVNQINDSEERIIKYLKKNESITNKQAREITGLSPSGIRKVFEGLIQKRVLVALGNNKNRCYKLNLEKSTTD